MKIKLLLGVSALVALSWTSHSFAFCRTTTCDTSDAKAHCVIDEETQCETSGTPLRWVGGCVRVDVQRDGAPKFGISADDTQASVQRAFDTWLNADCGDGSPSIAVEIGEQVSCDVSEFSSDHHNANIVMFREDVWPYVGGEDALGITRLRFNDDDAPGELWDADIEINAVAETLAVGKPKSGQVDLDSLITHEVGHLLGLGHTLVPDATMLAGYTLGSIELRTLAPDDVAGICAIYPPGRKLTSQSCEPRHGFSELCAADQPAYVPPKEDSGSIETTTKSKGCAFAVTPASHGGVWLGALVVVGGVWQERRRRAASKLRR